MDFNNTSQLASRENKYTNLYLTPFCFYMIIENFYKENLLVPNDINLSSHLNEIIKVLKFDFKPSFPNEVHKELDGSRLRVTRELVKFCKAHFENPSTPEQEKILKILNQISGKLLREFANYD
jgi:hypothetical protein